MANLIEQKQALHFSEKALERAHGYFTSRGICKRKWAAAHGVSPSTVYEVLSGRKRCIHGDAHKVAVLIGLKEGQIEPTQAA